MMNQPSHDPSKIGASLRPYETYEAFLRRTGQINNAESVAHYAESIAPLFTVLLNTQRKVLSPDERWELVRTQDEPLTNEEIDAIDEDHRTRCPPNEEVYLYTPEMFDRDQHDLSRALATIRSMRAREDKILALMSQRRPWIPPTEAKDAAIDPKAARDLK